MSTLPPTSGGTRVEMVDEWHPAWERVLSFIDQAGKRGKLQVTPAGWVSARQTVLAAFIGDRVVGHLAFHVEPLVEAISSGDTQPTLMAKLDACAVADGYDEQVICDALRTAAIDWARRIRCNPEPMGRFMVA